jgi:putative sigma-54 modulation protein
MQQIQFRGHNVEVTANLREYIFKKFKRIRRHADNITSVHVELKLDNRGRHTADTRLHVPGAEIYALAESNDMHEAIDNLTDKLVKQLKVYKGKKNDKKIRQQVREKEQIKIASVA